MHMHLFLFYKGLSGQKSLGEHPKILAISFKVLILYLAFFEGASISPIKPRFLFSLNDNSS